jgi:hypothetical protein
MLGQSVSVEQNGGRLTEDIRGRSQALPLAECDGCIVVCSVDVCVLLGIRQCGKRCLMRYLRAEALGEASSEPSEELAPLERLAGRRDGRKDAEPLIYRRGTDPLLRCLASRCHSAPLLLYYLLELGIYGLAGSASYGMEIGGQAFELRPHLPSFADKDSNFLVG